MPPYSMDLRERVLAACDSGFTTSEVAETFDVSASWIRRLKQRRRETGDFGPRQYRHGPPAKLAGHEEELAKLIHEQPDATAKELAERLSVDVSRPTVDRTVRRLGYSFKKRHFARLSKVDQTLRPSV